MLGDWVQKLLAERGANREDFLAGLERGLAEGKCPRCDYREPTGCSRSYWVCDPAKKAVLFWERRP